MIKNNMEMYIQYIRDIGDTGPALRDLILQLAQQELEEVDDHWRLQTHRCGFVVVKYTFIGRRENVNKDAAYVLIGLHRPMQKEIGFQPSGTNKDHPIAPDLWRMPRHIYRQDFAHGLGALKNKNRQEIY